MSRCVKILLCLLLLGYQMTYFDIVASERNPDKVDECEDTGTCDDDIEIGDMALDLLNDVHDTVSSKLIGLSDQIDNFFVSERMEAEGSNTQVLFSYFVSEDIHGNVEHDYLFKARLSLPKTEGRLRLVVESSLDPVLDGEDSSTGGSVNDERNSDFTTALQLIFTKSKYWQVSSKTGIRFVVPPDPFTQLRIRRLFFYDGWVTRAVETFFVSQSEGFGESTALELEHAITKDFYFRSHTELTVVEKVENPDFTQRFSIYQRLAPKLMLVYSAGTENEVRPNLHVIRNYINARFRHNFYKKWAFYEIVPELSYDRKNDFEVLPLILLKLDIVFGKI